MEIFGIVLSIPVAFVASAVYCFLLSRFVVRRDVPRRALWFTSAALMIVFGFEVALLITIGAVQSQAIIGPGFYAAHLAIFFLGPPVLANVLILPKPGGALRWYWAVPLCTLFAFALVLLQIGVSEALYGVE